MNACDQSDRAENLRLKSAADQHFFQNPLTQSEYVAAQLYFRGDLLAMTVQTPEITEMIRDINRSIATFAQRYGEFLFSKCGVTEFREGGNHFSYVYEASPAMVEAVQDIIKHSSAARIR